MSGPLSESAFAALVEAGCPTCHAKKVAIDALLVETVPLLAGEVYGSPSWAYKGEDFVRGTYRVGCHGCKSELFSASAKAFTPARVVYEGRRADKPRAQAVPEEPGFHAFQTQCKVCRRVVETRDPCPLCGGEAQGGP